MTTSLLDPAPRTTGGRSAPATRATRYLSEHPELATPVLVVDLATVAALYRDLCRAMPWAQVHYAVKANPAPQVLTLLAGLGSCFDVASPGEIDRCLELAIDPGRLSYGNTVKKERDVRYASRVGVRTFAVDCPEELEKVVAAAVPGTVLVRVRTDGAGADWPLSRKFGCSTAEAEPMLLAAARAGWSAGIAFHVGSQQRDLDAWSRPLREVGTLARRLRRRGVDLAAIDLGGGLPSHHREPAPAVGAYGPVVRAALTAYLDELPPRVMVEPGRYLVGDAGVLRSEVVQVTRRAGDELRWVYLDVGLFGGLAETLEEAIRYRVRCVERIGPTGPVALAGPTCDSADVLYERHRYDLPLDLRAGDHVDLLSTGAYTTTYSSVWFNGFPPLAAHYLPAG